MVKISVIVPVYNVEKYISECLDSILSQDLTDIEVICIDDGSTDGSLDVLRDYQMKDNRIRLFAQDNKGLGNARNVGMDNACGEYITFIDSDDYFTENAFRKVYDISKNTDADFTLFKLMNFNDETRRASQINYFNMPFLKKFEGNTFNYDDVGERLYNISVTAPGKLFKRSFIDKLRFPENLIFEDTPFIIEAIFMADKMYFLDEYLYMRRIRKDSITRSCFSRFSDCIDIFNMMADITRKYDEYDRFKEKLFTQKVTNTYTRFSQVPEDYKNDFFIKLKDDFLSNKEEFESAIDVDKVTPRSKRIFYSAINSRDYRQFDKQVLAFEVKKENKNAIFKVLKGIFK